MKKSILLIIILHSTLFILPSFAQEEERKPVIYKTDATLPVDFETYIIHLGEFNKNSIPADSLKYLVNEKIKVEVKHTNEKIKVDKFTFSYMKYLDIAEVFTGINDTLNVKMKEAMLHALKGDVFYIEAKFVRNKLNKSAVMSLRVK